MHNWDENIKFKFKICLGFERRLEIIPEYQTILKWPFLIIVYCSLDKAIWQTNDNTKIKNL